MRILIVNRYFWPDTPPYAAMLRAIASRWSDEGHEVTVLTAQPAYIPEASVSKQERIVDLDGFKVVRCRMFPESRRRPISRIPNVGVLVAAAAWRILHDRGYDIVMAATMPPIVVAGSTLMIGKLVGASFVYHAQDIYPEVAVHGGILRRALLFRLLRRIDIGICRKAAVVVTLSEDMAATYAARGIAGNRIRIIKGFDLEEVSDSSPLPSELVKSPGAFRVLFAGNIGRFQGLDAVIAAAGGLVHRPAIRFDFLGEGVLRSHLDSLAGDLVGRSVFFHGYYPRPIARRMVETADLALVTLDKNVIRAAYPGKTLTYLSVGVPLLVMVEEDSELSRMVTGEGIGFSVAPGDLTGLVAAIEYAHDHRLELGEMRTRAAKLFARCFGRDVSLRQWSDLIRSIEAAR